MMKQPTLLAAALLSIFVGGCTFFFDSEASESSGEYYLTLMPFDPTGNGVEFIATTQITGGDAPVVSISMRPLCRRTEACALGQTVGNAIVASESPLDGNSFTVTINNGVIPAGANLTSAVEMVANVSFLGTLLESDAYCGSAEGSLLIDGSNRDLTDATFAAIRIPDGTRGSDLPPRVFSCP